MTPSQENPSDIKQSPSVVPHNWVYRRVALPVLALLRMGTSPQKLAWSLAVGLAIGINPVLGTTTILCVAVAFVFRLNVVASQLGNHIVYPLQLLLVIPFIRMADRVFHTAPMPLSRTALLEAVRTNPLALTRQIWLWEWHAFVIWAVVAAVAIPVLALGLTPLLQRLPMQAEQQHQSPVIVAGSPTDGREERDQRS